MSATFGPFFPPAADLRVLRGVLAATWRDSLQVSRPVKVADTSGGETTTWPGPFPTIIPCRVADGGGQAMLTAERVEGTRLAAFNDWVVGVAPDVDIRTTDRLLVTAADGVVHTLEVLAIRTPRTIHLERLVVCREIA